MHKDEIPKAEAAKRQAEEIGLRQVLRGLNIDMSKIVIAGVSLNELLKNISAEKISALRTEFEKGGITQDNIVARVSQVVTGEQPKQPSPRQEQQPIAEEKPVAQVGVSDSEKLSALRKQLDDKIIEVTKTIKSVLLNYELWKDTGTMMSGGDFKQLTSEGVETKGNVDLGISEMNNLAVSSVAAPKYLPDQLELLNKLIAIAGEKTKPQQTGFFSSMFGAKPDPKVTEFFENVKRIGTLIKSPEVKEADSTKQIISLERKIEMLEEAKNKMTKDAGVIEISRPRAL